MSAETFCACTHGVYVHTMDGCAVKGCGCTKYVPVHETDRRSIQEREDAARRAGFTAAKIEALAEIGRAREEALAAGFADCEALVSAGLLALAEKEDLKACEPAFPPSFRQKYENRAALLREMSLAVSLGQFRTAECNERAIVAAHREAAGFNSSKAGGEARMKALTPAKRKKIATEAARARWAAKKTGGHR